MLINSVGEDLPGDLSILQPMGFSKLSMRLVRGEVVGADRWTEANTHGGGDGGVVIGGYGASSHRKIKTTIHNKREIWVKTADGHEVGMKMNADRVSVRSGQKLIAICAVKKRAI